MAPQSGCSHAWRAIDADRQWCPVRRLGLATPGVAARVGVWVSRVETLDQDDVESGAPGLVAAKPAFYPRRQMSAGGTCNMVQILQGMISGI
jgi:hypothetical protein